MPIISEVDPYSNLGREYRGVAAGGQYELTRDGDAPVTLTPEEAAIHAAAGKPDGDVAKEFAKMQELENIIQEVALPARSHGLI